MSEKRIVTFSGGIDSQAAARWVLNRYDKEDVILINADAGGHEHPMTTEFIEKYSREIHPVITVSPTVADLDGRAQEKVKEMGLKDSDPMDFLLLSKLKGFFPASKFRFCTHSLKVMPMLRWHKENLKGAKSIRYTGVRREESNKRRKQMPVEFDDYFGVELHHPIIDWTKQMCFDFVKYHNEPINPLYELGFNRVGCAPCINATKGEILNWHKRFPEALDKIRAWEKEMGKAFFKRAISGIDGETYIDDVIEWAKTARGGKQYSLDILMEPEGCTSDYGLCG